MSENRKSITAEEVLAELRKGGSISAVDEIRREVRLDTGDARIQAYATVRDGEVQIRAYWPECPERDVTATVAFWRFEYAFLDDEPDARWYATARVAETVRDVAVGLAGALTATEGRLSPGWTSTPCTTCSGSGLGIPDLSSQGAPIPVECAACGGSGAITRREVVA
ncbi:hypothetical protein [Mycolicibacterium mageritense]|uniref:hypothetical protein n=1 Tax=Mycolicibacterium mageritense TaxID=53462 RepID=UPI0011D8C1F7|nr:hypothetical protein [Mycolicibacterium mageritense]TXI62485.1 MAG: hypothetical protein E6Q55_12745 [Mycolicibacterium mageritense]